MTSDDITVLLVDDQSIIRAGLRTMLSVERGITVVGEAGDGLEAITKVEMIHPDVVLMDIRMPSLDGISATRRIMASPNPPSVVVLTTFQDEQYLREAIAVGAAGFLLKDAGPDILAAAVRMAAEGDSLIDSSMTRRIVLSALSPDASRRAKEEVPAMHKLTLARLSDREREVLGALARGLSNATIAAELHLSEPTVKTHIRGILTKTATRTRAEAAVFAYESGFVRPAWLDSSSQD